jgi:hypothetical protein
MDSKSYNNQCRASWMSGGRIPHPLLGRVRSPTGLPMQSLLEVALFAKPMYPTISRPSLPPPTAKSSPTILPDRRKPFDLWPVPPRRAPARPAYEPERYEAEPYQLEHYEPTAYEPKAYEPERDVDYAPSPSDSWLVRKIDWIVHEVKPLSELNEVGQVLRDGDLEARLVVAIVFGLAFLLSILGPLDFLPWWAALGTGVVTGALITPVLGKMVQFVVRFLAYALFFTVVTIAAGAVLAAIALLASAAMSAN